MTAIATRRKGDAGQLAAELAEARAEIAGLRVALKAVAALALGVAYHRTPASTAGSPRDVAGVCRAHGVHGDYAAAIEKLFA